MARTVLSHPFDSISGKLNSTDKIVMRTRNGRTHAYVVTHPNELPQSETQKRNSSAFGAISKQVHAEMSDPIKRAEWEKSFAEYTKKHNPSYKRSDSSNDHHPYSSRRKSVITTLYGYIFQTLHERSISNSPSPNS